MLIRLYDHRFAHLVLVGQISKSWRIELRPSTSLRSMVVGTNVNDENTITCPGCDGRRYFARLANVQNVTSDIENGSACENGVHIAFSTTGKW